MNEILDSSLAIRWAWSLVAANEPLRRQRPPRPWIEPRRDEDDTGDGGVREPRNPKPAAPVAPAVAPEPVEVER